MTKRKLQTGDFDPDRAEKMLMDWANLPEVFSPQLEAVSPQFKPAVAKLTAQYPDVCRDEYGVALAQQIWPSVEDCQTGWILGVREHLRAVWDAVRRNEYDVAEQRVFGLRGLYARVIRERRAARDMAAFEAAWEKGIRVGGEVIQLSRDEQRDSPLVQSALAASAAFVQRGRESGKLVDPPFPVTVFDATMRHLKAELRRALCCKNPECPTPYFFRTVRGQKYCDPKGDCWAEVRPKQQNASREAKRGPAKPRGRPRKSTKENQ